MLFKVIIIDIEVHLLLPDDLLFYPQKASQKNNVSLLDLCHYDLGMTHELEFLWDTKFRGIPLRRYAK